jgi:hypothetical protein
VSAPAVGFVAGLALDSVGFISAAPAVEPPVVLVDAPSELFTGGGGGVADPPGSTVDGIEPPPFDVVPDGFDIDEPIAADVLGILAAPTLPAIEPFVELAVGLSPAIPNAGLSAPGVVVELPGVVGALVAGLDVVPAEEAGIPVVGSFVAPPVAGVCALSFLSIVSIRIHPLTNNIKGHQGHLSLHSYILIFLF